VFVQHPAFPQHTVTTAPQQLRNRRTDDLRESYPRGGILRILKGFHHSAQGCDAGATLGCRHTK